MAELPDIPTELSYDGRMINTKIVHTLKQVIKPVVGAKMSSRGI